ncbi:YdbH domain-containing protein [Sphingomonas sp.]|jgi:hypothetical protein|uniref:YdbH domain-containing protein n=1 Tax=Sphingomonas sp. TaxID=28214 RepID=UPI002ED79A7B
MDAEPAGEDGARRFPRRRRTALAVALALIVALAVLWLVRKPIAEHYVDRTLAAARVPARYTIADLGFGAQRLTNVVIGDPAAPDLVADWIETRTRLGPNGAELSGVRAGRVRVRGRLVDGRLSLGAIDRLLPKAGGRPFKLPRFALAVEDGRMRLETPYGVAGLALSGSGRLDDGFAGRLALIGERFAAGDCSADRVAAAMRVRSTGSRAGSTIALEGPARFARAACAGVRSGALASDLKGEVAFGERLGWTLGGRITVDRIAHAKAIAAGVAGTFGVRSGAGATGWVKLAGRDVRAQGVAGAGLRAGQVSLDGNVVHDPTRGIAFGYAGKVALVNADARRALPRLDAAVRATTATPLGPVVAQASRAFAAAAGRFGGTAQVRAATGPSAAYAILSDAALTAASGARVTLARGTRVAWRNGDVAADGALAIGGGGLPRADVRFGPGAGGARRITVSMAPYEAGGARLVLTPVRIAADAGWRIVTRATLSGPLGDGRVDALTIPLDLRLSRGTVTANPACAAVGFQSLKVAGLALRPTAMTLCPTGTALVAIDTRGLSGGARVAAARLAGTLGTTPVTLGFSGATLRLADSGFTIDGVQTRIGAPGRVTRLDFARIGGQAHGGGLGGQFTGGAGQIANVPLLLSDATGDWNLAGGALRLTGALAVADAQTASPRFQPMQARDVALSLVSGAIEARGTLHEPTTGTKVADVAIAHALGTGTGRADLTVPTLTLAKGFQPELLTRLTFGVIADVRGTLSGEGRIDWDARGVTSTGTFRTAGTDLAAAFGPVTGISGEIRFTDLLALESAPGQQVTIKSVNPGIPVTDGVLRYRTLPDARVQVEGGAWPFAGGRLTLDPTLLDFSRMARRRMTFRVDGVAADRFLQQFDFKNLDATGTFDGVLPMVFDDSGGRIERGQMTVREGGGTIRYVGEIGKEDVGFWGNVAFQALKSLRYRSLTLTMNGPLAGEMVTDVRFAGVNQGEGAQGNFLIRRLQRLPFVFNVRIKAPFRGLIDSAQSFYEPSRLIQRNLPALLEQQQRAPVQPPASAPVP